MGFTVQLGINRSTDNTISKGFLISYTLENCINKTPNDLTNPIVKFNKHKLNGSDLKLLNYCYIESFNRYYFVTNIELENNDIVVMYLKCDVLMTYKTIILSANSHITRTSKANKYSLFYNDGEYKTLSLKTYDKYFMKDKSPFDFTDKSTILVTIGGV